MNFQDEVVLVTGGSRGIGRAIAKMAAEAGGRVAVHYGRDKAAAETTLAALPGGPHEVVQAELADPDAVRGMVDGVSSRMGRLDVVVNNAGIWIEHKIADVDYKSWQTAWKDTLDVNLVGPANVCWAAAQQMIPQGRGRIVCVSSRGAFRGEPEGPAYGASKAGLNAMSQSLAKALGPHGISVYAVAPGFVETDMAIPFLEGPAGDAIRAQSPLGRVAKPAEVARAVLVLAERGSEFLTGTIVDVNGASYLRS